MTTKETPRTAYFLFFMPKGVSAHPIAMYFDKASAVKRARESNPEYTELRTCGWVEGNLPLWSETTLVKVEPINPKKKKETTNETKSVDMKGKKCEKCKKGTYQETSIYDDWDGVLHCDKCGNGVKRHRVELAKPKKKKETKNETKDNVCTIEG